MKNKFLLGLLFIVTIVTITGCGKKDVVLSSEKIKLSLKDDDYGETTMEYRSDDGFEVVTNKNGKRMAIKITCKKDNFILQMYHSDSYSANYEDMRLSRMDAENFEELEWNGYKGYIFNDDNSELSFNILLKEDISPLKVLYGHIEFIKQNDETNISDVFKTRSIQKMLNTIVFSDETKD